MDLSTCIRKPFDMRSNTLSYMSAEAMAAAFGGDPSYIPAKVGFIYGDKKDMPTESDISRNQSWNMLLEELAADTNSENVDIQVVPFSYSPTLGSFIPGGYDGSGSGGSGDSSSSGEDSGYAQDSEGDYCNILSTGSNAITFHAVSNSQDAGARGSGAFINGRWIYQAVLLGYHGGKYYIISRVSLKSGNEYRQKPSGFEIALDWTIAFM